MNPSEEDEIHNEIVYAWNLMCLLVKWGLVKNPDWEKLQAAFDNDWYRKMGE